MKAGFALCVLIAPIFTALAFSGEGTKMSIEKKDFGKIQDGKEVFAYTLTNANGLKARIITYGGIVTSLSAPDRDGNFADIVLGYDNLDQYVKDSVFFGAIIGRYANRIAKGKFTLDGTEYSLPINDGPNHLHGGPKGFHKVVWHGQAVEQDDGPALKLTYTSPDGEEGYPGNLSCTVTYTLTNNNELKIAYEAETDKPTVVNLTHHSYFNLGGYNSGDILSEVLTINANSYTPTDNTSIPTGEIKSVKGTPFDFTKPTPVGARIAQVKGGYDHNYVLNKSDKSPAFAARVSDPGSGRVMEVYTTEPGIQLYTGNFLDGTIKGKGAVYEQHDALCLETQHYPDSPNKSQFPSTVLRPGKKFSSLTIYKFSKQ
jgi:aldose 1-epimerase